VTDENADIVEAADLEGRRVDDVVGSWCIDQETGVAELLHVSVHAHGLGYVRFHAHNGVRLTLEQPEEPYAMPELHCTVEVESGTPAILAGLAGSRIRRVRTLLHQRPEFPIGWLIETDASVRIAIADVGDDLAIGAWPDPPRWRAAGIVLAE